MSTTIAIGAVAAAQGLGPTGAAQGMLLIVLIALGLLAVGGAVLVTHRRRSGDD